MELRDEQNHLARSNSPRPSNEERESFSPRLIQSDDTFLTPKTEKYVLRKSPIERKHTLQLKGKYNDILYCKSVNDQIKLSSYLFFWITLYSNYEKDYQSPLHQAQNKM